jgi:hypothetical protein
LLKICNDDAAMVRARRGASWVPPALDTCAPSRSLGGIGKGPCTGPASRGTRFATRTTGTGKVLEADVFAVRVFAVDVFAADGFGADPFAAEVFAAEVFAADVFAPDRFDPDAFFTGAAFFLLSREFVAAPAERAAAAGAVEVRVFRLVEREVEGAAASAFLFERVTTADDAEDVFRFVRPEPAADRTPFRDMILTHGRALR